MFFTYILKSAKNSRYYIGYTENMLSRLSLHNAKKVTSTKHDTPWELFHVEEFKTEKEAINRERQIKSWKSRKAIERLKFKQNDPDNLLSRTLDF